MPRYAILYSDRLREYDLGHVLTGECFERFMALYRRCLGDRPVFEVVNNPPATDEGLRLVHTWLYIDRVRRCEGRTRTIRR